MGQVQFVPRSTVKETYECIDGLAKSLAQLELRTPPVPEMEQSYAATLDQHCAQVIKILRESATTPEGPRLMTIAEATAAASIELQSRIADKKDRDGLAEWEKEAIHAAGISITYKKKVIDGIHTLYAESYGRTFVRDPLCIKMTHTVNDYEIFKSELADMKRIQRSAYRPPEVDMQVEVLEQCIARQREIMLELDAELKKKIW